MVNIFAIKILSSVGNCEKELNGKLSRNVHGSGNKVEPGKCGNNVGSR
jgi:hypothetical protein